jgi:hypothetical protein
MTSVAYGLAFPATRGVLGGRASDFTPAALFASGEKGMWYASDRLDLMWQDDAGTIPAVVDSPVGLQHDLSGNGAHRFQATASKRPILRQSGSSYYLQWDGVDDELHTASLSWASAALAIYIAESHASFGGGSYGRLLDRGTTRAFYVSNTSPDVGRYVFTASATSSLVFRSSDNAASTGTWRTVLAMWDGSLTLPQTMTADGSSIYSAANSALSFGNRSAGDRAFSGYTWDVVVINRTLTASELNDLSSWFGGAP